jgi:hypothetical protein
VEGTAPEHATPERAEDSVGSGVNAILEAARETAEKIVADAERRGEETRLAIDAYAERVRWEAEEEAKKIRTTAHAEGERLHAAAHDAARAEAEELATGLSELRNETNVLASRRDRILRELESITHVLEDAIADVAPEEAGSSLGDALDVRRRS